MHVVMNYATSDVKEFWSSVSKNVITRFKEDVIQV